MNYFTGLHPHIRSEDSTASRYWTAAVLLLPCVIFKIISANPPAVLLPALLLAAAAIHYLSGFLFSHRPKNTGWRQGIPPLFAILWFLVLPAKTAFLPAVFSFAAAFFLVYECFGGLGAYPINPVLAGLLFLSLFFPQENLTVYPAPGSFAVWNILTLLFLAFGGLYLGVRKKIRLWPPLIFIGSVLGLSAVFAKPLDFELLYCSFILGFYFVPDSNTWPLKAGLHSFAAAGAGVFMAGFILCGAEVLLAGAISLTVWNLFSPWFDSVHFLGLRVKAGAHG